ncbi:MAG: hypothetical protein M1825_001967 [Sarcosagium campestre]|nr:MAG: hypothetical protein M1825_001967 [Sarcosagium campestre]
MSEVAAGEAAGPATNDTSQATEQQEQDQEHKHAQEQDPEHGHERQPEGEVPQEKQPEQEEQQLQQQPGHQASTSNGPVALGPGGFVAPSSYLRARTPSGSAVQTQRHIQEQGTELEQLHLPPQPVSALDREQAEGLRAIREFLKIRTSYDILPLSFRLIVFDTSVLVKKSLSILLQNGIVSAPLWDSESSAFAGLLTTFDYINVIQYYWQNPDAFKEIDKFQVEKAIGVDPIETVSIHPDKPLYEACRRMLVSRARRIPLVATDDETNRDMIISVVTQYRILKFVAVNVKETQMLRKPLSSLNLGTYDDVASAHMDTPVMDVIHMLVKKGISSVPIVDKEGVVLNVFEAVDVITLIKGGIYDDLSLNIGDALLKRSEEFAGIYTCSLDDRLETIFDTIRKSRVHRLVIIDEEYHLKGVLTLSDILEYILLEGEGDEP